MCLISQPKIERDRDESLLAADAMVLAQNEAVHHYRNIHIVISGALAPWPHCHRFAASTEHLALQVDALLMGTVECRNLKL